MFAMPGAAARGSALRVLFQGKGAWLTSLCGVTSAAPVGGGEGVKLGGKTPFFAVGSLGGAGGCLK